MFQTPDMMWIYRKITGIVGMKAQPHRHLKIFCVVYRVKEISNHACRQLSRVLILTAAILSVDLGVPKVMANDLEVFDKLYAPIPGSIVPNDRIYKWSSPLTIFIQDETDKYTSIIRENYKNIDKIIDVEIEETTEKVKNIFIITKDIRKSILGDYREILEHFVGRAENFENIVLSEIDEDNSLYLFSTRKQRGEVVGAISIIEDNASNPEDTRALIVKHIVESIIPFANLEDIEFLSENRSAISDEVLSTIEKIYNLNIRPGTSLAEGRKILAISSK